MYRHIFNIFLLIFMALGVQSCSDENNEPELPELPEPPANPTTSRSVLVYMVADNNLSGWATEDLKEMRSVAARECDANSGRWIVYYSGPDHKPRLIEFDSDGNEVELATYSADEKSVSIARMRQVIADFRAKAPADTYGIVFWSHGTGWIDDLGSLDEPVVAASDDINPLSYGYDGSNGARMKVTSLARALEGNYFDFIYFDCCHMATVEVAYQLRNVASTMVACPTELGTEGMPYDKNIAPLLNGDVRQAAANTFDYYQSHYNVMADINDYCIYGCAITVIDLTKMEELAGATREIFASGVTLPDNYIPVRYFRSITQVDCIYDIAHYMEALQPAKPLLDTWHKAYSDAIICESHTPKVYYLPAENFSGLGCNIITSKSIAPIYGYDTYGWWTDVVSAGF